MRSTKKIFFVFLMSIALGACSNYGAKADSGDDKRLYLWLHGADDYVPPSVAPPLGERETPSAFRIAEAVRQCGVTSLLIEDEGLSGSAVSVQSSKDDRKLIECVRPRLRFGFNATRTTPTLWNKARQGELISIE